MELTPADQAKLFTHYLWRIQVCVDQLTGMNTMLKSIPDGPACATHVDHTLKVLSLLQGQLHAVMDAVDAKSPSQMADASEWLLDVLKVR